MGDRAEEGQIQEEAGRLMEAAWLFQEVAGGEANYLRLSLCHARLEGRPQDCTTNHHYSIFCGFVIQLIHLS